MTPDSLNNLLQQVRRGRLSVNKAMERLRHLPFEDLGFAKIDHHRTLRQGFPEVVFAQGKAYEQVEAIVAKMMAKQHNILITRGNQEFYQRVRKITPKAKFPCSFGDHHDRARTEEPRSWHHLGGFGRNRRHPSGRRSSGHGQNHGEPRKGHL